MGVVLELIAALKAKEWTKAAVMGLRFLADMIDALDPSAPRPSMASSSDNDVCTLDDLTEQLEKASTVQGLGGSVLLTLVWAIIKKLLDEKLA